MSIVNSGDVNLWVVRFIGFCEVVIKSLCGFAFGLVAPHDLHWCNIGGKMWLVLLLSSGFSQLMPRLYSLELARWHAHLFNDQGIWHLKQGMWRVGHWIG